MTPVRGQAVGGVQLGVGGAIVHTQGLSQWYPGGGWTHVVGVRATGAPWVRTDTAREGPRTPKTGGLRGGRGGAQQAPSRVLEMDRTPGRAPRGSG